MHVVTLGEHNAYATGVRFTFTQPAEHAATALIGKKEKAVIAKYSF